MSFHDIPPAVEAILAAAGRVGPHCGPYLTYDPGAEGPAWELHPFKRWLVLGTEEPAAVLQAVACSILARSAWLGKGPSTAVPPALRARHAAITEHLHEHLAPVPSGMARYRVAFPGLAPVYVMARSPDDAVERAIDKCRRINPALLASLDTGNTRAERCV